MIKCKNSSTGLFIKSSYMNQVNSLTFSLNFSYEPIVVVHKATMVANHLHKTGKWGTVTLAYKNLVFWGT